MEVSADRIGNAFAFVAWETTRAWLARSSTPPLLVPEEGGMTCNADSGSTLIILRDYDLHTAGAG